MTGQQNCDIIGQVFAAHFDSTDGMDMVLKHEPFRRVREPDRRQPAGVRLRQALLARTCLAVPQQEARQMLPCLPRYVHRRCLRADRITHRLGLALANPAQPPEKSATAKTAQPAKRGRDHPVRSFLCAQVQTVADRFGHVRLADAW